MVAQIIPIDLELGLIVQMNEFMHDCAFHVLLVDEFALA